MLQFCFHFVVSVVAPQVKQMVVPPLAMHLFCEVAMKMFGIQGPQHRQWQKNNPFRKVDIIQYLGQYGYADPLEMQAHTNQYWNTAKKELLRLHKKDGVVVHDLVRNFNIDNIRPVL